MTKKEKLSVQAADFRKRAEKITRGETTQSPENIDKMSPAEVKRTLHELRVHQIELEMQNEELHRSQVELEDMRALYFDLYDMAPVGYLTVSEKGMILESNLTVANLLGVAKKSLILQPLTNFIIKEDQEIYYRQRKMLVETDALQSWELRMVKKNGTAFWAHLEATTTQDAKGKTLCRIALSGITERKRFEEVQAFLAQTSSGAQDEPFFEVLARYLAQNLSMDYVCIDRLEGDELTARTVAVWCDGHFEDNVTYALKDTPCGDVVGKTVCCFPASVCQFFPHDQALQELRAESYVGVTLWSHTGRPIGLIAVIGRHPLSLANRPLIEDILKMVGVRAAGEMERLDALEMLRDSEERYRTLANRIPDIIYSLDSEGNIVTVNSSAFKRYGYSEQETKGKPFLDFVHPEDREILISSFLKTIAHKRKVTTGLQFRIVAGNGVIYWFELNAHSHFDSHDCYTGEDGVLRDITIRKQAEEELRKSQEQLRDAHRLAHIGIWNWIAETDTVTWTEELYHIAGLDPMIPAPTYAEHPNIYAKESWDRLKVAVEKVLETGVPYQLELEIIRPDGTTRTVNAFGGAAHDKNGRLTGLQGTLQDITAHKQMEAEKEKLEAQNRQLQKSESLGRMAGAIAHHFNNQLGVVIGYLEMVIEEMPKGAAHTNSLTKAMQSAWTAADMSGLMLTYLGQTHEKVEQLDISYCCRKILPILKETIPANVIMETDFQLPKPIIMANNGEIQQILTNLITNAREAIGNNKGTISLSVKTASPAEIPTKNRFPIDWQQRDKAYACLEVTDTGSGIEDKDIEKLFDPFFSTKFTGRGMGLAVVLGLANSYKGVITVDSKPGKGSTFRVFFPVSEETLPQSQTAESDREVAISSPAPKKMEESSTVLVVEDEEMLRDMAAAMLEMIGFTVLKAKDGIEALEIFGKHQSEIKFVLTDLTMPRMNGWETLTALRKLKPNIPVILASGYDLAHVMEGDHPELPQAFLAKPYNLKALRDAISQTLSGKELSMMKGIG